MNVYLDPVTIENKDTLFRLLQYSLFEESETDQNDMNENAIFEYRWFENYFTDKDRFAFFAKERNTNKILGFVMINSYVQNISFGHSIAEFLVIPKYRRNGIGTKIAEMCFEMFQGYWEVKPSFGSKKAYSFCEKVISNYTRGNYEYKNNIFVFKTND